MSTEVVDLTASDEDFDVPHHRDVLRESRVAWDSDPIQIVDGPVSNNHVLNENKASRATNHSAEGAASSRPRKRTLKPLLSDDDEIEILYGPIEPLERPIAGPSKPPSKRKRAVSPDENNSPFLNVHGSSTGAEGSPEDVKASPLEPDIDEKSYKDVPQPSHAKKRRTTAKRPGKHQDEHHIKEDKRQLKEDKRQLREDERLARKLAAQDRKEYAKMLKEVEKKKEGIVFRVAINADGSLEDGSPAHPDDLRRFEPWRELFERSGYKVKRFHWVVNYELERRFEEARAQLRGILGHEPEEIKLFHGTSAMNIDSIIANGLRIGGIGGHRVTNGRAAGYGVYLGEESATSMGYAMGADRMFACRVLPGRVTQDGRLSHHRPKLAIGDGPESYHGAGFWVVRHAALVLPCYMIEWDMDKMINDAVNAYNQQIGGVLRVPFLPAPAMTALLPLFGTADSDSDSDSDW